MKILKNLRRKRFKRYREIIYIIKQLGGGVNGNYRR